MFFQQKLGFYLNAKRTMRQTRRAHRSVRRDSFGHFGPVMCAGAKIGGLNSTNLNFHVH